MISSRSVTIPPSADASAGRTVQIGIPTPPYTAATSTDAPMPPTGGVFVSWGSPDAAQVRPIVERLKRLGIVVWEYSEDMPAGARIQEQVMDVINDVRVALVCFSDATANRPWIETEVAWAIQAQRNGNQPLQHVIPVWVGPHPNNLMPTLIGQMQYVVIDVSDGSDAAYSRLDHRRLGQARGRGADHRAGRALRDDGGTITAALQRLERCGAAGGAARDVLDARHGRTAAALRAAAEALRSAVRGPHAVREQEPITETIGSIVSSVNDARAARTRTRSFSAGSIARSRASWASTRRVRRAISGCRETRC